MKFRLSRVIACAGLLLVGVAAPLSGQRNATGFETRKLVKLHGAVTRIEWINPHAWIHVAVKTANGAMEEWKVEAAPPDLLMRRGLTKESLSVGTEITIAAYPLTNGSPVANGSDVTLPDGKTVLIGSTSIDGKNVAFGSTPVQTPQRK